MRRFNAVYLYAMLLSYMLIFTSCSNDTGYPTNTPYKSDEGIIYNDNYYMLKYNTIEYVSLSDESTQILNLCSDPLCSHTDKTCPNYYEVISGQVTMVIDEAESDKNDFYPVFYVSTTNNTKFQIVRYNSKNNVQDVVVDNIVNPILQIWIFNDNIFYLCSEGDTGQNIYVSDKEGADPIKLKNSDNLLFYIRGITDDSIIYSDYEGNIYISPHDLSAKNYICSSVSMGNAYVFDDKLFFAKNLKVAETIKGTDFLSCNIYYINLNDTNMPPVLAIENVLYIYVPLVFQSNNLLYYCTCDNISFINCVPFYDAIEQKTNNINIFKDGTSTIYSYNISTNESRKIIDDTYENLARYYDADDTYFIYSGFSYNIDTIESTGTPTHLNIYNYQDSIKKTLD